jgi:hypothetical protein
LVLSEKHRVRQYYKAPLCAAPIAGQGSAVLVAACGCFVAELRYHAEIVRAYANRESSKSVARPFPVGSHSLGTGVAMLGAQLGGNRKR